MARASYSKNEEQFQFYARQKLHWGKGGDPVKEFRESIKQKGKSLDEINRLYTNTVALGAAEPAICSLRKIGLAYENMADSVANAPMLRSLPPEAQEELKNQLEQQAQPIREKAADHFAAAVTKSRELGVRSDCAAKSLQALRTTYRPAQYPPLLEELASPKIARGVNAPDPQLLGQVQPVAEGVVLKGTQASLTAPRSVATREGTAVNGSPARTRRAICGPASDRRTPARRPSSRRRPTPRRPRATPSRRIFPSEAAPSRPRCSGRRRSGRLRHTAPAEKAPVAAPPPVATSVPGSRRPRTRSRCSSSRTRRRPPGPGQVRLPRRRGAGAPSYQAVRDADPSFAEADYNLGVSAERQGRGSRPSRPTSRRCRRSPRSSPPPRGWPGSPSPRETCPPPSRSGATSPVPSPTMPESCPAGGAVPDNGRPRAGAGVRAPGADPRPAEPRRPTRRCCGTTSTGSGMRWPSWWASGAEDLQHRPRAVPRPRRRAAGQERTRQGRPPSTRRRWK